MSKSKRIPRKRRDDDLYRRTPSGKYVWVGHDFRGFPMDGIWIVQDGKCSMSCLIGAKERVPIFALNYRVHEQELCKAIQEAMTGGGMSLMDEARLCCDFFAKLAEKGGKDANVG